MRRLAVIFGMLLAVAQSFCADVDFELPSGGFFLGFNAKDRKFTAAIESEPLKKVMAKLGAATGWKIYVDPAAQHTVSAQFTERGSGDALRLLLGGICVVALFLKVDQLLRLGGDLDTQGFGLRNLRLGGRRQGAGAGGDGQQADAGF